VVISPDNRWLGTGGFERTARLWDLDLSRLSHTMRVHSHATDESSIGNKSPNPNNSTTRSYSLTAFSVSVAPQLSALHTLKSARRGEHIT
jgi:WD40 repeat protein